MKQRDWTPVPSPRCLNCVTFANAAHYRSAGKYQPGERPTYKLVRKVFQNTEHVHVVGCEDLRLNSLKRFQEVTKRLLGELKLRRQQCRLFFFRKLRSALKKWHITARFSLNFFTLGM